MAGRKIRGIAEARTCLAAAESSGLERAAWARAQGLDARSLNAWRLNLERAAARREAASVVRLVELVPKTEPVVVATYVILCGDLAVEVDERFEAGTLRRLLEVVRTC